MASNFMAVPSALALDANIFATEPPKRTPPGRRAFVPGCGSLRAPPLCSSPWQPLRRLPPGAGLGSPPCGPSLTTEPQERAGTPVLMGRLGAAGADQRTQPRGAPRPPRFPTRGPRLAVPPAWLARPCQLLGVSM
ncbi:unnamed protein product [Amoebophrya sp. A120]|nr:unnamed protein product [Amoebophrya sp. A120]|eukprot:GSA120T00012968001.1